MPAVGSERRRSSECAARSRRLLVIEGGSQVRSRLCAGGNRIRTSGTAEDAGLVADLSAGGNRIRTSGTAEDAGLVADLYAHNASRQIPQKGVQIRQSLACAALRREWWARPRRPGYVRRSIRVADVSRYC